MTSDKATPRPVPEGMKSTHADPFPLPWSGDDRGCYIWHADGSPVAQMRGWGHLTGRGQALAMGENDAVAAQVAAQRLIVTAVNQRPALLAENAALRACLQSFVGGTLHGHWIGAQSTIDAARKLLEGKTDEL